MNGGGSAQQKTEQHSFAVSYAESKTRDDCMSTILQSLGLTKDQVAKAVVKENPKPKPAPKKKRVLRSAKRNPARARIIVEPSTLKTMRAEAKHLGVSFDEYVSALIEKIFDLRQWAVPRWEGKAPYCNNFARGRNGK